MPAADLTLALWQTPHPATTAGALPRLDAACAQARAQGANLLVTPEMFLTGYAIGAERVAALAEQLLLGAPSAQKAAKALISAVHARPIDDAITEETAQRIAAQRATAEGRDGVAAFLDKRPPAWLAD